MYLCVVEDAVLIVLTRNCYLMCRVIGKVVDRYSGTVVGVTTYGKNGWGYCRCGRQWWRERGGCVRVMEDELDDGGAEKVTYVGGWTKCIVLKEGVGLEEVRRMGDDEHGHLYVGDSDGMKRRTQKATVGRSPHSFTDERRDFNRGKPFSATDKPIGN
ncbi:hypothetical protein Cgig2_015919 [Carnegiea gigantea]|uniref:Uncharacterized protein n=1 Tax=Carnegiea gigantea TaxID=171969 RepID=A0A9Q1KNQ9_9CARY|nr:hypothetical protein Cgig2_015919 [Carnegiea gigantea]